MNTTLSAPRFAVPAISSDPKVIRAVAYGLLVWLALIPLAYLSSDIPEVDSVEISAEWETPDADRNVPIRQHY